MPCFSAVICQRSILSAETIKKLVTPLTCDKDMAVYIDGKFAGNGEAGIRPLRLGSCDQISAIFLLYYGLLLKECQQWIKPIVNATCEAPGTEE